MFSSNSKQKALGALSGILANILLGLSSVFWTFLGAVNTFTLLGYRVYFSVVAALLVVCASGQLRELFASLNVRQLFVHAMAAILIAVNWGVFIWASIHGRVLESSVGYLIAPIMTIVIGVVVYKESLSAFRAIAVVAMLIGVSGLLIFSPGLDVRVYLAIGLSWGGYCSLRKLTSLNVFSGLLLESIVLAFMFTPILLFSDLSLDLPDGLGLLRTAIIFSCGLVSIIPLALFSFSSSRISMTSLGLLQFVLPITQFIVATVVYEQTVSVELGVVLLVVFAGLLLTVLEPIIRTLLSSQKRRQDGT